MRRARCALISVYDKRGLVDFASGLSELDISILSTGGTADALHAAGIPFTEVSEWTGFPEALGGRVKTLHPKIHAGILADRESEAHRLEMERLGAGYIDIVVVNLTPPNTDDITDLSGFMEKMDIGGHALLRAAAKNFKDVVVVCNPARYSLILDELKSGGGSVSEGLRVRLAREALDVASSYDLRYHRVLHASVAPALGSLPTEFQPVFHKMSDLRYGENPHQRAAVYLAPGLEEPSVVEGVLHSGKDLSFNNYVDLDAALDIVKEFRRPACAIVKHANPCGVAIGDDALTAYCKARATDPESAFGGIAGFNVAIDEEVAKEIVSTFMECVIAPSFTPGALAVFRDKKNLRILEIVTLAGWLEGGAKRSAEFDLRFISGGLLLQERDYCSIGPGNLKYVTDLKPSVADAGAIFFTWTVAKHVRSNAVVIANADETVGIGAGQMSRVDAARLAVYKAKKPLDGCVAASDGFFPFRDGVDELARAGIKTIVQPGGSRNDAEVIAACNELGVAMVLTGMRCFKH